MRIVGLAEPVCAPVSPLGGLMILVEFDDVRRCDVMARGPIIKFVSVLC
jgi:hypothetical protein